MVQGLVFVIVYLLPSVFEPIGFIEGLFGFIRV